MEKIIHSPRYLTPNLKQYTSAWLPASLSVLLLVSLAWTNPPSRTTRPARDGFNMFDYEDSPGGDQLGPNTLPGYRRHPQAPTPTHDLSAQLMGKGMSHSDARRKLGKAEIGRHADAGAVHPRVQRVLSSAPESAQFHGTELPLGWKRAKTARVGGNVNDSHSNAGDRVSTVGQAHPMYASAPAAFSGSGGKYGG